MTSPGLKRPLESDTLAQATGLSASATLNGGATGGEPNATIKIESLKYCSNLSSEDSNIGSTNGSKRRCTASNFHKSNDHILIDATSSCKRASGPTSSGPKSNTPYADPSSTLAGLSEHITALIDEELQQSQNDGQDVKNNDTERHGQSSENQLLTVSQTEAICEKLITEMDRRLREDYDRILARKLAEQYDIFAKANYLNTFVESAHRIPVSAAQTLTSPSNSSAATPANPSINAFTTALHMQRSMAAAAAAANSQPATTTPNSIQDLNHLAASLSAANGHPNAISATSHHLSYNSFQQQAAAAVAAAAAIQQQAAVQHHSHHQQSSVQQTQQMVGQHRVPPSGLVQTNTQAAGSTIPTGPVLLTSNLDEQLATPEALFTLFGVFGDVIRVKILFNKKDNALIQMADATQAQVAQGYLDKQRIFGKNIRVTRSKHQIVQMPRDGNQSDAGLTKDFTNSPLHRFKIPGSRNYLNIYPPSNTLHISNIPATVDELDLHKAFKVKCGFEFTSFKFFAKDRKMALMKFASTEHATIALIKMHNFQISEENNLRVSFSKTLI